MRRGVFCRLLPGFWGFGVMGLLNMPWDWLTGIYDSKIVISFTDVDWIDERRGT